MKGGGCERTNLHISLFFIISNNFLNHNANSNMI